MLPQKQHNAPFNNSSALCTLPQSWHFAESPEDMREIEEDVPATVANSLSESSSSLVMLRSTTTT
jgi:hypothetical protein